MTESEWRALYEYLLSRLRELNLSGVAGEVEYAATHRIVEHNPDNTAEPTSSVTSDPSQPVGGSTTLYDQNELTESRAPNAQEAFAAALDVLRTRVVELPTVLQAVGQALNGELSQVEWRPDVQPGEVAAEFERFRGADLIPIINQLQIVQAAFTDLDIQVRSARK